MKQTVRYALYWCSTEDGDEDWFVVAKSARNARRFHELEEGYDPGDADAEFVCHLPESLHRDGGWVRSGIHGEEQVFTESYWPDRATLIACGAEIFEQPRDALQQIVDSGTKIVKFGDRVFQAGDIVANVDRELGLNVEN